LSIKFLKKTSF